MILLFSAAGLRYNAQMKRFQRLLNNVFTTKGSVRMNWWQSLIAIVLCSGIISALQLVIQHGNFFTSLGMYFRYPILFVLNGLPVVIVLTMFWLILRNVFYAASLGTLTFGLLSYVNLLKILDREDPLVPADLVLFREALDSAMHFSLDMYWSKVFLIAGVAFFFLLLGIKLKSKRFSWKTSLLSLLAVSISFVGLIQFGYSSKTLYQSFTVPNQYNIASVFNTLGFNYCFLYNVNLYQVEKPEGYHDAEIKALEYKEADKAQSAAAHNFRPHVIVVMCEAYSDVSEEDCIEYGEHDSPMKLYKDAISKNAINGHIVVPNYGAGTANTEFDVLTGMQTNMLGNTSSFRLVRKRTENLTTVFHDLGYTTAFLHPGNSWFYNRNSVYEHFGMDAKVFKDVFDESDYKGTIISDDAFLEELIRIFEEKKKEGPVFAYGVSIQNHQAYTYGKFGMDTPPVPTTKPVSDSSAESLSVYMQGVRDSSKMLDDLCRYIDSVNEPIMIVFFGDHRPNLLNAPSELGLGYNDFTRPKNVIETFKVPFMIRVNDAYAKEQKPDYSALKLGQSFVLSANYVGSVILELLDFRGVDAYFDELMELRKELPVIKHLQECFMLQDQSLVSQLPEELKLRMDRIHRWMYYRLKH